MEFDFEQPASRSPRVFTVSDVTGMVRSLIEEGIGVVRVEGEISNLRRQSSGHQYFTLKDEKCQLACVLFQRQAYASRSLALSDGMQVQVQGQMSVYEARGQYQLIVEKVVAAGAGLLQARFEALKKRLSAEGLFAPEHKKPIPRYPRAVGVVTSPTGAAIQDMLNVLHRRAPWVQIVVNPVRVQGEGAAEEIAAAITEFDQAPDNGIPEVDVIVVCRGGGSAEDLWEFNEEIVARAIFAAHTPVVSAVGHEIDFTISDFVADLRCPTPSAAAEMVVPDGADLVRRIAHCRMVLDREVLGCLRHQKARLAGLAKSGLFQEPRRRLNQAMQDVDRLAEALRRNLRTAVTDRQRRVLEALAFLRQHRPDQILALRRKELGDVSHRLEQGIRHRLEAARARLQHRGEVLRLLSPEGTLKRGYSLTLNVRDELIRHRDAVGAGDVVRTRLADGTFESVVQ